MKKLILPTVLLLSLFAFTGSRTANAQKSLRLDSTPKSFQKFYAKFKKAVVEGDKKIVASMTQFPFKYGFGEGDEGTFTKAQFIEKFDDIFGEEKDIFEQKNPLFYSESGPFDLTDEYDATHYIFEKKGASYKFTAYVAEP